MASLEEWIEALRRADCEPEQRRDGSWISKCPAHQDDTPSLSLRAGDRTPVLVKCFAGCEFKTIVAALDLPKRKSGKKRQSEDIEPATELPSGPNVVQYHYVDADGDTQFVVVRKNLPTGKKRFEQWSPLSDGRWWPKNLVELGRPLLDLPRILAAPDHVPIMVVEGEKCVRALTDTWAQVIATTWASGGYSWNRTDWKPLSGRRVRILADADDSGRKCSKLIANRLHLLGCTDLLLHLPDGDDGRDVADMLKELGPAETAKSIDSQLLPYSDDMIADVVSPPLPQQTIVQNDHYQLLGLLGTKILFKLSAGKLIEYSREAIQSPAALISLAPALWWHQTLCLQSATIKPDDARNVGDTLIRAADQLGETDIGRVRGRGAVRTVSGDVYWHLGDRLLGRLGEIPISNDDPLAEEIWLAEPAIRMHEDAKPGEKSELREAVMGYRWATEQDGRRFLGWLIAAIVGGALEWRPHALMVAEAAAGKSWLLKKVAGPLLGPAGLRASDVTVAAVSRKMKSSALGLILDEAEPSAHFSEGVFTLLRSSSGADGDRWRSDMTGAGAGVLQFSPRFSALLSATKMPVLNAADSSRLSLIQLGPRVDDWPATRQRIEQAMAAADRIRSSAIRECEAICDTVDEISRELEVDVADERQVMIAAALTAGWRWWGGDGNVQIHTGGTVAEVDAYDALREIMAIVIRKPGDPDETVGELLVADDSGRTADSLGIRRLLDGIAIAHRHAGLLAALRRTPLRGVDVRSLLLQIPHTMTSSGPVRFGAVKHRCVLVPDSSLEIAGIDLTPQPFKGRDSTERISNFTGEPGANPTPTPSPTPTPTSEDLSDEEITAAFS